MMFISKKECFFSIFEGKLKMINYGPLSSHYYWRMNIYQVSGSELIIYCFRNPIGYSSQSINISQETLDWLPLSLLVLGRMTPRCVAEAELLVSPGELQKYFNCSFSF